MTQSSIWNLELIQPAIRDAFKKLNPIVIIKNPVMFIVEVGSLLTTIAFFLNIIHGDTKDSLFSGQITLWLWFTVIFANFAEAMAEGRGKAQAENLRKSRTETQARKRTMNGEIEIITSSNLKRETL